MSSLGDVSPHFHLANVDGAILAARHMAAIDSPLARARLSIWLAVNGLLIPKQWHKQFFQSSALLR
jgi:hypothetical protein